MEDFAADPCLRGEKLRRIYSGSGDLAVEIVAGIRKEVRRRTRW